MNQPPPEAGHNHSDWLDPYDPLCKQAHRIIDELQDWYGVEEILVKLGSIIELIELEVHMIRKELSSLDYLNDSRAELHFAAQHVLDYARGISKRDMPNG